MLAHVAWQLTGSSVTWRFNRDCCVNLIGWKRNQAPLRSGGDFEELTDERDLASDTWIFAIDVAAFNGSNCFDPAEGRLCRSQGSKALSVAEKPLHGRVIALDDIVAHFLSICRML